MSDQRKIAEFLHRNSYAYLILIQPLSFLYVHSIFHDKIKANNRMVGIDHLGEIAYGTL